MSGNTLNQIAQGLYQNIGVGINFTPFTWTTPAPIGVNVPNSGVFTQIQTSSLNTNSITASTATFSAFTFTSVSTLVANFQQITTSSFSTFSAVGGGTAAFPQILTSSISTFSASGTTVNFPQIITSSIVGTNANFSAEVATNSVSTFSITGTGTVNFPQILTSSISTFSVTGTTNIQQISELVDIELNAAGNWPHNFNNGSIFYHSNIASNFTTALFNVPTIPNRGIVTTLVLIQGATPYYSSTLTINGSETAIRWVNAVLPIPNANRVECESFTLLNIGGTWSALGQYNSFAPA